MSRLKPRPTKTIHEAVSSIVSQKIAAIFGLWVMASVMTKSSGNKGALAPEGLSTLVRYPSRRWLLLLWQHFRIQNCRRALAAEKRDGIFDSDHRHSGARFDGRRSEVRREDNVVAPQAFADQRLALENIERRAGNRSLLERGHKRGLLHDRPARRATARPMRPNPTMPSVLPQTSVPHNWSKFHCRQAPERANRSPSTRRRATPIRRVHVKSAVVSSSTPGVFVTATLRSVHAGTSILSYPRPHSPRSADLGPPRRAIRDQLFRSASR